MNVVFCAYDGHNIINGINAWLLRLLPALQERGHTITVLFSVWAKAEDCTIYPVLKSKGINCIAMPFLPYTDQQIKWICNYIKSSNTDLFIPGQMPSALHAMKWIKADQIPCIAILHNDDSEYAAIIREFLTEKAISKASAVVTVSQTLSEKVKNSGSQVPVFQIAYGASVPKSKSSYNGSTPFKVVYAGRLVEAQKNIYKIARTLSNLVAAQDNVEAFIYGSGPAENQIRTIAAHEKNQGRFHVPGNLSGDDLQLAFLSAHVFLLLSDYEGIPVALMEAMACGVVPICKRIDSGIPELVKDKITGFLIDDESEVENIVKYLSQNNDYWKEISSNSKEFIQHHFSAQQNIQAWDDLINNFGKHQLPVQRVLLPKKLNLPPPNAALGEDRRKPILIFRALRRIKTMLESLKK